MVNLNLPNGLSMTRLLMVPLFFLFTYYWLKGEIWMLWPARAILLLIVASDFFDGYLARVRGEVTQLGGILDPLADKLFVTASFVLLAVFDKIHDWLAITVVTKDILVSIGWCVFAVLYNKVDVEPSFLGKTSTALQFLTVFALVILPSSFPIVILEYLTATATAMALIHYAYLASRNTSIR